MQHVSIYSVSILSVFNQKLSILCNTYLFYWTIFTITVASHKDALFSPTIKNDDLRIMMRLGHSFVPLFNSFQACFPAFLATCEDRALIQSTDIWHLFNSTVNEALNWWKNFIGEIFSSPLSSKTMISIFCGWNNSAYYRVLYWNAGPSSSSKKHTQGLRL